MPISRIGTDGIENGAVAPADLSTGGPYWDGSSNFGVGTTSPTTRLQVTNASGSGTGVVDTLRLQHTGTTIGDGARILFTAGTSTTGAGIASTGVALNSADLRFYTGGSNQNMTLDASGNLGIGTTTLNQKLNIYGDGTNYSALINFDRGGVYTAQIGTDGAGAIFGSTSNHLTRFITNNTERARITEAGALCVGVAGNTENYRTNIQFAGSASNGLLVKNTASSGGPAFLALIDSAQTLNNTGDAAQYQDSTTQRWTLRKNGGLANFQANNVNLSDRREKTNFAPAKDYLDVICAIPVQTFNYIDQAEDDPGLTLGVVAQDVEAVAPELVSESDWSAEKDGSKMRLSIYQTDLQYALMKCIQELKAELDATKAEIAALKGAV